VSTIKASSDHLVLSSDGSGKEVKIQRDGTEVLATTSTGVDVTGSVSDTDGNVRSGRKNLIINGGFDVWQRGTSGFSSNDTYTSDRWKLNLSGGTGSISRNTFTVGQTDVPNNPKYYLDLDVTAGNDNTGINHKIEDVASCAGQTVTVSFYAKGANPGGGLTYVHLAQNFGSGGSAAVDTTAQSFTLTGTWQRFTFQFDVPSITGKTIGSSSYLWLLVGQRADTSTNAWNMDIANVQLELGSVATDFEHRSYGEELALCQRYYYQLIDGASQSVGSGWFYASTSASVVIPHPVTMRTTPSVVRTSGTNYFRIEGGGYSLGISGNFTVNNSTPRVSRLYDNTSVSGGTTGHGNWWYSSSSSARLALDAEL